jgi:hypothetical protein
LTGTETLLYLVGVPALIVVVVWALAYRGGPGAAKRYRQDRPLEFTPVWYLANHGDAGEPTGRALEAGRDRAALPAGQPAAEPASEDLRKSVGGASDRW